MSKHLNFIGIITRLLCSSLIFFSCESVAADPLPPCRFALLRAKLSGQVVQGLAWPLNSDSADYILPFPESGPLSQASSPLAKTFSREVCQWLRDSRILPAPRRIFADELLPPLPNPINVIGVGLNYPEHQREVSLDELVVFPKRTNLSAAKSIIVRPNGALLDWEVELAIVVRQKIPPGTEINAKNLASYIAGFTVANDVTDRGPIIQDQKHSFTQAKTAPTFLPVGPFFVPIEQFQLSPKGIPDLVLKLTVNGARKQQARTGEMSNSVYTIIETILRERDSTWLDASGAKQKLLQGQSLEPGDLILTGTPGGTAIRAPAYAEKLNLGLLALTKLQDPKAIFFSREYCSGKYLRDGDIVQAAIDRLGAQENRVLEIFSQELPIRCDRKQEVARFLQP